MRRAGTRRAAASGAGVILAANDQSTFQGFYGFAEERSGMWQVVASGSAEVGCPPATTTTTTTTTTTVPPTTTTPSQQSAISAAITAFQTSQGVPSSKYQINNITVSTVDPSWTKFSVGPTPSNTSTFQGGYGFVHQTGGTWTVVDVGSAAVGCTPSPVLVPTAVLTGFGLRCPPPS